jgi:outer membrane protein TolC
MSHDLSHARGCAAGVLAISLLGACASDETRLAPESPERPWPLPTTTPTSGIFVASDQVEAWDRGGSAAPILDSKRSYSLAELIDLAQRNNPQTRQAWEQARQAALEVGLVESAYLPQLSAEAIGGFQRTPLPIPASLVPQGYFTSDTREILPTLAVKWLLFDFGRKRGAEAAARENSFVANVAFTGAHQRLTFAVSRDYFALGAARGKLDAAEHALRTARIDQEAVESRRSHGMANAVELAQAQRQTAQAQFNLARALGTEHSAYEALLASIGISPTTTLRVAGISDQDLPSSPTETVDRLVTDALSNRPDILAALGKVRAAQSNLDKARADHNPTIALMAQAYQNIGGLSSQGSPYYTVDKPGWAVFLRFSWPLYDGGQRDAQDNIARSQVTAARAALEQRRVAAAKDVTDAYYSLSTSLAEHDAAMALVRTAQTAHDAELDAYHHGVGTYTDLVNGENSLTQAQTELEASRADVHTAAAALAFATGSVVVGP